MTDNNKVTIDAEWFAELYAKAENTDKICMNCREKNTRGDFESTENERTELKVECLKLRKERDELKKELEEHNKNCRNRNCWLNADYKALEKERDELMAKLDAAEVDRETYKDRAEAAERCIDEIYSLIDCEEADNTIGKIIRAYRAAKEAR